MSRMPQVTALELARSSFTGFADDRQSGSHLTLWHEEREVSVTVPCIPDAIRDAIGRTDSQDAGFSVMTMYSNNSSALMAIAV